jgi:hypothetical protein
MVEQSPSLLVLCRDLLFVAGITSAAGAIPLAVKVLREIPKSDQHSDAQRMIVDLNEPGFLQAAAEWKCRTGGQVTVFVSHVDTDTMARAKAAGPGVASRGQFVSHLPQLLRGSPGD